MTNFRQLSLSLRVAITVPWLLLVAALALGSTPAFQQVLIDAANKPTTDVSLSSTHWTGTLDAARLPALAPLLTGGTGTLNLSGYSLTLPTGSAAISVNGHTGVVTGAQAVSGHLSYPSQGTVSIDGSVPGDAGGSMDFKTWNFGQGAGAFEGRSAGNHTVITAYTVQLDFAANAFHFSGDTTIQGSVEVDGPFIAEVSGYVDGQFEVASNAYFDSSLYAGAVYTPFIYSNGHDPSIDIGSNASVGYLRDDGVDCLEWTYSGITVPGFLTVNGNVNAYGDLIANGNLNAYGNVTLDGPVQSNSGIRAYGDGLILKSHDGSTWQLVVSDTGVLSADFY